MAPGHAQASRMHGVKRLAALWREIVSHGCGLAGETPLCFSMETSAAEGSRFLAGLPGHELARLLAATRVSFQEERAVVRFEFKDSEEGRRAAKNVATSMPGAVPARQITSR